VGKCKVTHKTCAVDVHGFPIGENMELMFRRWCWDCKVHVALGPAADTPEVLVEVRAAEIATECGTDITDAWLRGTVTDCERDGWEMRCDPDTEPTCVPEEVGRLARAIVDHDTRRDGAE
jgi:hypothetical protein